MGGSRQCAGPRAAGESSGIGGSALTPAFGSNRRKPRYEEDEPTASIWREDMAPVPSATQSAGARVQEAREKANEQYQKVYERRSKFMKEEMTGFVWLYLQK